MDMQRPYLYNTPNKVPYVWKIAALILVILLSIPGSQPGPATRDVGEQ